MNKGRPKGSGDDDMPCLRRIANMLASDPSLTFSRAANAVADDYRGHTSRESFLHRLRRKWKGVSANLLAEALAPKPAPSNRYADEEALFAAQYGGSLTSSLRHLQRAMELSPTFQLQGMLHTIDRNRHVLDTLTPGYLHTVQRLADQHQEILERANPLLKFMGRR